jgi:hypothetical protein
MSINRKLLEDALVRLKRIEYDEPNTISSKIFNKYKHNSKIIN